MNWTDITKLGGKFCFSIGFWKNISDTCNLALLNKANKKPWASAVLQTCSLSASSQAAYPLPVLWPPPLCPFTAFSLASHQLAEPGGRAYWHPSVFDGCTFLILFWALVFQQRFAKMIRSRWRDKGTLWDISPPLSAITCYCIMWLWPLHCSTIYCLGILLRVVPVAAAARRHAMFL